eukprot:CAMPEP_0114157972 /NCGR_PEP_ID=MMETSP0043_2-20121206/26927_1 /TAXON_ID=464988 /ORGANISM="Hemiselmis andersenii, Strain CCMP644" /LENGTH=89 /DNA_ID=CAMNT_0001253617 /DNA_START=286 /DNA_END=552 /DNA_ORIENTATION=+
MKLQSPQRVVRPPKGGGGGGLTRLPDGAAPKNPIGQWSGKVEARIKALQAKRDEMRTPTDVRDVDKLLAQMVGEEQEEEEEEARSASAD